MPIKFKLLGLRERATSMAPAAKTARPTTPFKRTFAQPFATVNRLKLSK